MLPEVTFSYPYIHHHDEVGRYRDARYRADARPDSFIVEWRRACNECGLVHGLSACKQIVGRTTIVKGRNRQDAMSFDLVLHYN